MHRCVRRTSDRCGGCVGLNPRGSYYITCLVSDERISHLFVYGTLRSAFANRYARELSRKATLKGIARVRGRLYDLGDYPGLRAAGDGWVTGELYELRDTAILDELDHYEGPEFRRQAGDAVTRSGAVTRAWVYEYSGPVWEDRLIASGDYLSRSLDS